MGESSSDVPLQALPPRRAILVLGMHRSGTSALTRLLNLVGARLGSDLLPALPENPEGFWESESVMRFGDQALSQAGSWWHDWGPLDPGALGGDEVARLKSSLKGLIERDFGDASLFAIKDPRTCRLLPLWLATLADLGLDVGVVHILRHPGEVAASLTRRNGFHAYKGLLLWLRYVLDAERDSRTLPRVFVSYQSLLGDWRRELTRISDGLRLGLSETPAPVVAEIERFLRPDMRHHSVDADHEEGDAEVEVWARRVYRVFARFADRGEDSEGRSELDAVRQALDGASRSFAPAARSDTLALFAAESQLAESRDRGVQDAAKLVELRAWIQHLDGQIAQRASTVQVLEGQIQQSAGRIRELEVRLTECQPLADRLRRIEATRGWRLLQALYYSPERRLKGLFGRRGTRPPSG